MNAHRSAAWGVAASICRHQVVVQIQRPTFALLLHISVPSPICSESPLFSCFKVVRFGLSPISVPPRPLSRQVGHSFLHWIRSGPQICHCLVCVWAQQFLGSLPDSHFLKAVSFLSLVFRSILTWAAYRFLISSFQDFPFIVKFVILVGPSLLSCLNDLHLLEETESERNY